MNSFFMITLLAAKASQLAKDVAADTASIKTEVNKIPDALQSLLNWGIDSGKHVLVAILIYYVGRYIIKFLNRLVDKVLTRRKVEVSVKTFLKSLVNILLTILLIVAVVNELGIDTTSFAALLAAAGVAIGMALSGNLQNFAGGLIVLLFKPYRVGDFIEAQNISGTVKEIQVFHTILKTVDNREVYIPNGPMSSGTVVNCTKLKSRVIEWVIGIDYGEDFDKVSRVLLDIVAEDDRILLDPAAGVVLKSLGDNSVNVSLKVWVKTADYWPVYFDVNKAIYATFNEKNINFPYPQITVHQEK
jgi:small conductance mechanosensitive channel